MTVGRIMALFMKTVQLSSQCRARGKCSCRLPHCFSSLLTALLYLKLRPHWSLCLFLFFLPFLAFLSSLPQKGEGWWVVEELALVISYRTRVFYRNTLKSGCFWWAVHVDSVALTSQMGWKGCILIRWGPQVCLKGTLSRIPVSCFGISVVYFLSWPQKDGYSTSIFSQSLGRW